MTTERSAGRELDVEIAERVMGLAFEDSDGTWRWEGFFRYLDEELPAFSTDISAAWLVVEKMERDGHFFMLARYTAAPPGTPPAELRLVWRAKFGGEQSEGEWAETAPLAICLAALQALASSPQITLQDLTQESTA